MWSIQKKYIHLYPKLYICKQNGKKYAHIY